MLARCQLCCWRLLLLVPAAKRQAEAAVPESARASALARCCRKRARSGYSEALPLLPALLFSRQQRYGYAQLHSCQRSYARREDADLRAMSRWLSSMQRWNSHFSPPLPMLAASADIAAWLPMLIRAYAEEELSSRRSRITPI